MKDGSIVEANLLVTATGYKNQQDTTRLFLGDTIADRIGKVWGFDEEGELRNMWRRTPQQASGLQLATLPRFVFSQNI